eukprot:1358513-Amphidinium_carterae.1
MSGELDKACPQWRRKNAYFAVLFCIDTSMQKTRATKSSSKTLFLTDPGSGRILYLNNSRTTKPSPE